MHLHAITAHNSLPHQCGRVGDRLSKDLKPFILFVKNLEALYEGYQHLSHPQAVKWHVQCTLQLGRSIREHSHSISVKLSLGLEICLENRAPPRTELVFFLKNSKNDWFCCTTIMIEPCLGHLNNLSLYVVHIILMCAFTVHYGWGQQNN